MKYTRSLSNSPLAFDWVMRLAIGASFILLMLAFSSHLDRQARQSIADEYRRDRSKILSQISQALEKGDQVTLESINARYGESVADVEYVHAVRKARAELEGTHARKTLAIGKLLDLSRQQEERKNAALTGL